MARPNGQRRLFAIVLRLEIALGNEFRNEVLAERRRPHDPAHSEGKAVRPGGSGQRLKSLLDTFVQFVYQPEIRGLRRGFGFVLASILDVIPHAQQLPQGLVLDLFVLPALVHGVPTSIHQ